MEQPKAVRIGENLETFLQEHEEIKIRFNNGKITLLMLPEEAELSFLRISHGKLIALDYWYNGKHVIYHL